MRYRRKPEHVEAMKYFNTVPEVRKLEGFMGEFVHIRHTELVILAGGETWTAMPGDYVLKDSEGSLSTCSAFEFHNLYEEVPNI
jgi:hypothetical protein